MQPDSQPTTRKTLLFAGILALALGVTGCAETQHAAETAWSGTKRVAADAFDGTKKVASDAWDGTRSAAERLAGYLKRIDILKKQHDDGNHDDVELEAMLKPTPKPTDGKSVKSAPAPKKGRSAPAPKKGKAPLPAPEPLSRETAAAAARTSGELAWPVEAGIVSSEFGPRWGHVHKGIDIAGDVGEPILAAADGEVIYSGNGLSGYGNVVILRHDARTTTLYAHNSALKVRLGDKVRAGQCIALLGSTGHSTGPHCHFEIRRDSEALNPRIKLAKSRVFENQQILTADASRRRG